jgi:hypothetical protein
MVFVRRLKSVKIFRFEAVRKMKKAGEWTLGEIFKFPIETPGQLLREIGKGIFVFLMAKSEMRDKV